MAQQKSVGISGIGFLLSVKYIRFMQRNAALDLFLPWDDSPGEDLVETAKS